MKVKIKKDRLQQIIQEEYALHERKKKLRENMGDLERPASRREHLGDAVTDVLVEALKSYLSEMNLDPGTLNNIMYDVEEPLLDVGIMVSRAVGTHSNFGAKEMTESDISKEMLAQAISEVLAEEGLGDGMKLGGNYDTGSGKGSESPYQTAVGGKKK